MASDQGSAGGLAPRGAGERLHKFLASTGAGSRRECETFIEQGRVSVNGKVVTKLGTKVDPGDDVVKLDGEVVKAESKVYWLLNKPSGYVCTNSDERGRPKAVDLVPGPHRIYTVGRLDAESRGLILLTNDGRIANVICHPRYRIEKVYQVAVRGDVDREKLTRLEAGVWLAEGKSSPARVRAVGRNPKRGETLLEMTVFEGRNREVRRVLARVGLRVRRLVRTRVGPLELGDLPPGAVRRLDPDELGFVWEAERMYEANREAWDAELPPEPASKPRPKRASKKPARGGAGRGGAGGPSGPRGRFGGARSAGGGPARPKRRGGGDRPEGGGRRYYA